ncbi:MAG: aspartate 1-decarboxylase [Acidobacteriota bacterium]
MWRTMCKSKIHRATVTDANLNYPGSLTVDTDLLAAADILPFEQVQVVNVSNGARFETYVIEGDARSGQMCLNGAAARLGHPGDTVIVISYALMEDAQARRHTPIIVYVDGKNRIVQP